MAPWKSDSLNISIGYSRISKDYITTCARRAHSKLAKIAHARTAFDLAVHTERTRNGDRRKTEIEKLAVELRGLTFFDDLPEVRCQWASTSYKCRWGPTGACRAHSSHRAALVLYFSAFVSRSVMTVLLHATHVQPSVVPWHASKRRPRQGKFLQRVPIPAPALQPSALAGFRSIRFWVRTSRPRPEISRNDSRIWPVRVQ